VQLLLLQQLHRAGHHPAGELQRQGRAGRPAATPSSAQRFRSTNAAKRRPEGPGRGSRIELALRQAGTPGRPTQTRPHLITLGSSCTAAPQARPVNAGRAPAGRVGQRPDAPGSGERPARSWPQGHTGENRNQAAGLARTRKTGKRRNPAVIAWVLTASSTTVLPGSGWNRCPTAPPAPPQAPGHCLAGHHGPGPARSHGACQQRNQQRRAMRPQTQSHQRPVTQDGITPGFSPRPAPRIVRPRQGWGRPTESATGDPWRSRWWARKGLFAGGPW